MLKWFWGGREFMYRLATLCKCKIKDLAFNYLGIPLEADPRRVSIWNSIMKKIQKKAVGVEKKFFVICGASGTY